MVLCFPIFFAGGSATQMFLPQLFHALHPLVHFPHLLLCLCEFLFGGQEPMLDAILTKPFEGLYKLPGLLFPGSKLVEYSESRNAFDGENNGCVRVDDEMEIVLCLVVYELYDFESVYG